MSVTMRKGRMVLVRVLFVFTIIILGLIYACNSITMAIVISANSLPRRILQTVQATFSNTRSMILELDRARDTSDRDVIFDFDGNDVIAFLHVQKTGGSSFERHLVQDLILKKPCRCSLKMVPIRCSCQRPGKKETWIVSRFTTGWICGVHADWSELVPCVKKKYNELTHSDVDRRFFFITFLREPISRYLSEYKHVQRGATWFKKRYGCGGKNIIHELITHCYEGKTWNCSSLEEFLDCPSNLAHNRQTRMLSDLTLVGCYNESYLSPEEQKRIMLASAKKNLESMAFFGLTEYQKLAQYYFERTFGVRFRIKFQQDKNTFSNATLASLKPHHLERIKQVNALDLELYDFARKLLVKRITQLSASELQHLGLGDLLESISK